MWTYSGFFIEKRDDQLILYSSDKRELDMFADEHGNLLIGNGDYSNEIAKFCKEPGLYQALIGYGSLQDPTLYEIKRVSDITWERQNDILPK
jgi:hypothetical protein